MAGMKKRMMFAAFMALALLVSACGGAGGNGGGSGSGTQNQETSAKPGEKISLTLMITAKDNQASIEVEPLVLEHFKDKYDITSKTWEGPNAEKTIKTTIAANNPIDLAQFWPNYMATFVNADMALDLTPYLDANDGEWRKTFTEGALDVGTYNGKVYNVPFASVYPMIVANQDILDQAGVKLPDGILQWDEFMAICEQIQSKTGIWPLGLRSELASWVPRNNLLTNWPDKEQAMEFALGNVSFEDPRVVEAFEASKELYENYIYPGQGALSATTEEVYVAFKQGKVAMMAEVNVLAKDAIRQTEVENVTIGSWPVMGLPILLGGSDGYMIPANAKHPEASVEIMKFLTSPEVLQKRVDLGVPVAVKGVHSDDPNYPLYSKDAGMITSDEVINVDPRIFEIIVNKMPANYIFNGPASLDELEKIRLEALKSADK